MAVLEAVLRRRTFLTGAAAVLLLRPPKRKVGFGREPFGTAPFGG